MRSRSPMMMPAALALVLASGLAAAGADEAPRVYDRLDFNLGPTGIVAYMIGDKVIDGFKTKDGEALRYFLVKEVRSPSPAYGKVNVGDKLYAVNGTPLDRGGPHIAKWRRDNFRPILDLVGRAIEEAEGVPARKGEITFGVERDGKRQNVTLTLKQIGRFSKTYPVDCKKTDLLIKEGLKWLESTPGGRMRHFWLSMAYLAQGEKKYYDLVLPELGGAQGRPGNVWTAAMNAIVLAEYTLATGDRQFIPAMEAISGHLQVAHNKAFVYHHNPYKYPMPAYGPMCFPSALAVTAWGLMDQCGITIPIDHFEGTITMLDMRMKPDGTLGYGWEKEEPFTPFSAGKVRFGNSPGSLSRLIDFRYEGIGNMGAHALAHHIRPWQDYSPKLVVNTVRGISRRRKQDCAGHAAKFMHTMFGFLGCGLGTVVGEDKAFRLLCDHVAPYMNTCRMGDGSFYDQPALESDKQFGRLLETGMWVTILSIPKHAMRVTGCDPLIPGVDKKKLGNNARVAYERVKSKRYGEAGRAIARVKSSKRSSETDLKAAELLAKHVEERVGAVVKRIEATYASGDVYGAKLAIAQAKKTTAGVAAFDECAKGLAKKLKDKAVAAEVRVGRSYYLLCDKVRKLPDEQLAKFTAALAKQFSKFAKRHDDSAYGKAAERAAELMLKPDGTDPYDAYFKSLKAEKKP